MPVAVRFALVPPLVPAAVAALFMQVATFVVLCVAAAIQGGVTLHGLLPFLLAGAIAPGLSNLFITVGIREAGSSRASVAFGIGAALRRHARRRSCSASAPGRRCSRERF